MGQRSRTLAMLACGRYAGGERRGARSTRPHNGGVCMYLDPGCLCDRRKTLIGATALRGLFEPWHVKSVTFAWHGQVKREGRLIGGSEQPRGERRHGLFAKASYLLE